MPDTFFYFSSVNSDERRAWLERMLVRNEVYFRSREQLNDPNELRPALVIEGTDKEVRQYAQKVIRRRWPMKVAPAKRLVIESEFIFRYRNPQWLEELLHKILDGVGLFCMSETATENLLWAHYADGHRGVCIEFDANAGLFGEAEKVTYTDQPPPINLLADEPRVVIRKSMLTKGSAWAYEREIRIVARWRDEQRIQQYLDQHDIPPQRQAFIREQHGPGYYSFPPGAVQSVILGERVEPKVRDWLQNVIQGLSRTAVLKRASVARDGTMAIN